jgi:integrase
VSHLSPWSRLPFVISKELFSIVSQSVTQLLDMTRPNAHAPNYMFRRGATYTFRRRVPDDVRATGAFSGKEHYHASLQTGDLGLAKRKASDLADWFDAEVRRARGVAQLTPGPAGPVGRATISREEFDTILTERWQSGSARDTKVRLLALHDEESAQALDYEDDHIHHLVASFNEPTKGPRRRRAYIEREVYPVIEGTVRQECERRNIQLGSPGHAMVREAIAEADIELLKTQFTRASGSPFAEELTEVLRRGIAAKPIHRPQALWTLKELAFHCFDVMPKGASWRNKVETSVTLFEAFMGRPLPIADIKKQDVREFVQALANCPVRAAMRFPKTDLKTAGAMNRARTPAPYPCIKPNTIRDTHFAALRWLLTYAHSQLDAIERDPTDGIKIDGAIKKGGGKAIFLPEELTKFFMLPVFSGCASASRPGTPGDVKLNDHRFWTPLLMLFTGARPSELAQLSVSDVKLEAAIPYICVLTEFDEDDALKKPYVVSSKTSNAKRDIPIHPELIRLGFGRYVGRMSDAKSERLFPEWKLSSDPRKLYSQASWIRMLNAVYIPRISARHPKPTLYSLRHTCKTRMVSCGLAPQYQNQLLGHAKVGMDAHYFGGGEHSDLAKEIKKLSYPGLNLNHLKRM